MPANDGGYSNENLQGGYYPSAAPPQYHMQNQQPPSQHYAPPQSSSNGQIEYQGGPNRDYREGSGAYPPPQGHDYRGGAPPTRAGQSSLTLGPGPLNNQSQYGGPVRYEGASSGQPPAPLMNSHNPYGSPPTLQRYAAESAPPMRPQSYDSHLPPKPNACESS